MSNVPSLMARDRLFGRRIVATPLRCLPRAHAGLAPTSWISGTRRKESGAALSAEESSHSLTVLDGCPRGPDQITFEEKQNQGPRRVSGCHAYG